MVREIRISGVDSMMNDDFSSTQIHSLFFWQQKEQWPLYSGGFSEATGTKLNPRGNFCMDIQIYIRLGETLISGHQILRDSLSFFHQDSPRTCVKGKSRAVAKSFASAGADLHL